MRRTHGNYAGITEVAGIHEQRRPNSGPPDEKVRVGSTRYQACADGTPTRSLLLGVEGHGLNPKNLKCHPDKYQPSG
jgi:hypothetical protein